MDNNNTRKWLKSHSFLILKREIFQIENDAEIGVERRASELTEDKMKALLIVSAAFALFILCPNGRDDK